MLIPAQPTGPFTSVFQAADRIDYWIRRHVHATDLSPSNLWAAPDGPPPSRISAAPQKKIFPDRDRTVWLSIGHCLKAQYDALAPPVPRHIAALVEQLETKNRTDLQKFTI
jgi:hypothetical protein